MTDDAKKYRVFLSAAEPSADAHCAALAREIRALDEADEIALTGVGGPRMVEAGVKIIESTVERAAMTYKAFSQVFYFHGVIKKITAHLKDNPADLVIVCDSPAFNFHVAKAAKSLGVQTLFYVAPQLWAWAPWRIGKLRKYCDKLCCILPFEAEWFAQRGLDAEFVGNPLIEGYDLSRSKKYYLGFEGDHAHIALMPGSRAAEIQSLWEPMQHIALSLQEKYPKMKFTAVAFNEKIKDTLTEAQLEGFECEYNLGSVYATTRASEFALVASGSATLQVAAAGCPMVIMYQSNWLLWHLVGRWLVTTEYLSLVNILAGRELVPEFMPYFDSVEPIADKVEEMLGLKDVLAKTSNNLVELVRPLAKKNASQRVAQIARQLLTDRKS